MISFHHKRTGLRRYCRVERAGKTTPLRMIVGLSPAAEGSIELFGQPIRKFQDWERIGYVPQKNSFNPLFPATVREVVMSGLYNRKNVSPFEPPGPPEM